MGDLTCWRGELVVSFFLSFFLFFDPSSELTSDLKLTTLLSRLACHRAILHNLSHCSVILNIIMPNVNSGVKDIGVKMFEPEIQTRCLRSNLSIFFYKHMSAK